IVFLAITLSDSQHSHSTTVRVRVKNAALFLNKSAPMSSFVEIKPHNSYRKRSRKYDSRFKECRTRVVPHTNRPQFDEEFRFKISRNNLKFRDRLGISMYSTNEDLLEREPPTRELLGCMTFSLSKLYDKFMDKQYGYDSAVKVCDEGYFLLNEIQGRETHMSENRIRHSKYYDEIGSSTMSTSSSIHSGSPLK
ncbi:Protein RGS-7 a, partial [Aphelenchoides avenae]